MPGGQALPGADRDHIPGGVLAGEHVIFHEDGHILAAASQIRAGNAFVNELIANIFEMVYIHQQRPDLNWLLEDRRSGKRPAPRYTPLADVDYLYAEVGQQNYFWFQWQLERIADFLVGDQSLPALVEKLQNAFPPSRQRVQTLEEIDEALETIRPGFLKAARALVGPSTIQRITPSARPEAVKSVGHSAPVIVRNNTDAPLETTRPNGQKLTVPAHSWTRYPISEGSSIKLPDGSCLTAREEPSLAVIDER